MFSQSSKIKASNALTNLWILDTQSGVCIFEQTYEPVQIDPDLVTGFLLAMRNFGREITDGDIKEIEFNNLRIALRSGKNVILAGAFRAEASQKGVKNLLDLLLFEFEIQFESQLKHWAGNTDVFSPFNTILEELINKKSLVRQQAHLEEIHEAIAQPIPEHVPKNELPQGASSDQKKILDDFVSTLEETGRFIRWKVFKKYYVENNYKKEFERPEFLISILNNRREMEQAKHRRILEHSKKTRDLILRQQQKIEELPLESLENLTRQYKIKQFKLHSKREEKRLNRIKDLEEKIQELQAELARATLDFKQD